MEQHNKKSLTNLVRAKGWRGDDARTPMLALALWLAGHEQQSGDPASQPSRQDQGGHGSRQQGDPNKGGTGGEQGDAQGQGDGDQGENQQQPQGEGNGDGSDAQQEGGERGGDKGKQQEGEGDAQQGKEGEGDQGQQSQQQKKEQQQKNQGDAQQGGEQGQQSEQQKDEQQQEELPPLSNKEWLRLLELRQIKTPHPTLRRVYEMTRRGLAVYLKGEAGSGKSTLARQLAKLLATPFGFISVTAGMSESQLMGWLLPIEENGAFKYVPAQLVIRCEHGGVFLLDEADAGDPNTLLILNALLANDELAVPHRHESPVVARHKDFVCIAAGNTPLGGGADERYSARSPLDAATSDRFVQVIVDYDESFEASLMPGVEIPARKDDWQPRKNPATVYVEGYAAFQKLRKDVMQYAINRVVSTRFLKKMRAMLDAGFTLKETMDTLTNFWSTDERSRVGIR